MEFASEALKHVAWARATQVQATKESGNAEEQGTAAPEPYSMLELLRWEGACEGLELERVPADAAAKVPECDPALLELLRWPGECEAVGLERGQPTKAYRRQTTSELMLWVGECEEIELEPAGRTTGVPEKELGVVPEVGLFEGVWGDCEDIEFKTPLSTIDSSQSVEVAPESSLCEGDWGESEESSDSGGDSQLWEFKPVGSAKEGDGASTRASTRPSTRPSTQPSTRPPTRPPTPPLSPRLCDHGAHQQLPEGECQDGVSGPALALRQLLGSAADGVQGTR